MFKDDILVFVEVKLRRGTGFGDPLEAVTPRKQNTLRSVAEHYLYTTQPHLQTMRFDVIGILAERPQVRLDHIEDAFLEWRLPAAAPRSEHLIDASVLDALSTCLSPAILKWSPAFERCSTAPL